jgi:hypothetical protein
MDVVRRPQVEEVYAYKGVFIEVIHKQKLIMF